MSAASTIASSGSESRRRIGSVATGSWAGVLATPKNFVSENRPRLGSARIVSVVGAPSFRQPYSSAASWQREQTST